MFISPLSQTDEKNISNNLYILIIKGNARKWRLMECVMSDELCWL